MPSSNPPTNPTNPTPKPVPKPGPESDLPSAQVSLHRIHRETETIRQLARLTAEGVDYDKLRRAVESGVIRACIKIAVFSAVFFIPLAILFAFLLGVSMLVFGWLADLVEVLFLGG